MRKNTMVELVQELEALNKDGKYDEMIAEAKAGEYHDFKNTKYICGKVEVVNKLSKFPELDHIRQAVINGEYDESPDEEDKAQLRKELENDPGLLRELGLE
ncbi:MAG: hypothetical protein E6Q36_02275 [Chryseobacterium sp.]|nr:MAG: hypothetical protein E6Q36_02275 [Chryseobacterium sp.]